MPYNWINFSQLSCYQFARVRKVLYCAVKSLDKPCSLYSNISFTIYCLISCSFSIYLSAYTQYTVFDIFQHDNDHKHTSKMTTALLKKLRVKVICGASSNGRWRSARSLTSTSSVMSSCSGRGLQWQPVKLWWTPCPIGVNAVLENNGGHTKYWHFGPNLDIFTYIYI